MQPLSKQWQRTGSGIAATAIVLILCSAMADRAEARMSVSVHLTAAAMLIHDDSAEVAAVVDRYHRALSTGDSVAALALLTQDAIILESGGIETRAEYRSHHLPSDIEFARAVPGVRGPVHVTVRGDVAWASSTSTVQGEFRGRAINAAGAELMVLVREAGSWKIAAIHWSSRTRR